MKKRIATLILLVSLPLGASAQARVPIDTERSVLTVYAFKAGLFSAFAHNHQIRAPITSGWIDASAPGAVELRVNAREMQVLDPKLPADKRAEVQRTMHGATVLDTEQYPEIIFVSRQVEPAGGDAYRVVGDLTLHGVTRPVMVSVRLQEDRYVGSAMLRQSEFAVKPISLAGGTIKVKDVVKIEFDIVPASTSAP